MELGRDYYTPIAKPNVFSIEYMRKTSKSRLFENAGLYVTEPLTYFNNFDNETINQII